MKNVRELFLNDGVDEQVLSDLKEVCTFCCTVVYVWMLYECMYVQYVLMHICM